MNLGGLAVSGTYKYILNQDTGPITLGNGNAVNWDGGGVVAKTGNQVINGVKTFGNTIIASDGVRAGGGSPGLDGISYNGYSFDGSIGDNDSGMFSSANGQVEFYSNNGEVFRVHSNGNIGIGNVAPTAKVEINSLGGTAFSNTFRLNAGVLGSTAGNTLKLASIGCTDNNQTALTFTSRRQSAGSDWTTTAIGLCYNVDNTETVNNSQLWLTAGGNVGIGTSAPTEKLHVNGNILSNNLLLQGDGTNGYIRTTNSSSNLYLGANNTSYLTILANGNVGIGRTPATNKLEVQGTASKEASGSWLANSDKRIKKAVSTITDALEKICKVNLVKFKYTDEYKKDHPSIEDVEYLNVIAQEFAEVFPDHVKESGDKMPDGSPILQVDIHPLTIYSAAAIQELKQIIDSQNLRISELESKLL